MYKLPELSYGYDSLQPYISREIMELHHKKHHQTYIDKVNAALESAPSSFKDLPIEDLLKRLDEAPEEIRQVVRNNGGGHYNHSFFWDIMTPGGNTISDNFAKLLGGKYGTVDGFKEAFSNRATAVFGSGWAWLMPDLSIVTTPNQDNPIMDGEPAPILGLDVWEHAYYLDYKNVRPDYITAWWKVVDWTEVERRYRTHLD
ncbi:superoxide dismutase [Candidatus Saccharibacteria bacterium]|jgi:Fe-Mn family superoxide dismutase|nr:superoxide dismutase [Candidatus Saccharibacteria bacterium]